MRLIIKSYTKNVPHAIFIRLVPLIQKDIKIDCPQLKDILDLRPTLLEIKERWQKHKIFLIIRISMSNDFYDKPQNKKENEKRDGKR